MTTTATGTHHTVTTPSFDVSTQECPSQPQSRPDVSLNAKAPQRRETPCPRCGSLWLVWYERDKRRLCQCVIDFDRQWRREQAMKTATQGKRLM